VLNLTATTKLIRVITSAAATVDVVASWVDFVSPSTVTPGNTETAISTAATTTVVAAPAASTTRNVKRLSARNRHASTATDVTVQLYDGTTAFDLFKATLAAGELLQYSQSDGFEVIDAAGNFKTTALSTGRFLGLTVFTAGTTFTSSAATRRILVKLVGGGGGGGGCSSSASNGAAGAGGGAGGYAEKQFDVSPSTGYTYAIGSAGTAGANTGGTGGTGGSTTFAVGATTVTGAGGVGGVGMTTGTSEIGAAGGAGGASTNGDLNSPGAPGDFGYRRTGLLGFSGAGADSEFGGGGAARVAAGVGNAATGYGAGGAGGLVLNGSGAVLGGVGTQGAIMVEEYA
jgi:hypothetical protein